jgi:hypothetical protein
MGPGMSVKEWWGSLLAWESELAALKGRLASVFGLSEVRSSAGAFIDSVVPGISRKTGGS